ncbi:MAG: PQQ-binding-like beta-propeller repeat protein [Pirellulaceae bacterium]|nr:PQQ-binding-like beta-propeller repeat protein [Pirellulaceae bacterium]
MTVRNEEPEDIMASTLIRIRSVFFLRTICLVSVLVLTMLALTAEDIQAADWPQFLGPNRDGISAETGLLSEWTDESAAEVWRVAGGAGMSGLAIREGKLVTLIQNAGRQRIVAYNSATGERLWQNPIAPTYRNAMGHGPRATPTIVGDRVFVFTGEGILAAVDFSSGDTVWEQEVFSGTGGKPAEYGTACSPLVIGKLVVVTAGSPAATMVAYDIETGQKKWGAGSDPAGYSSPSVLNVAGQMQLVAFTGNSLLGLHPKTGAALWRHPYVTEFRCNTATPLSVDGEVFISSGENHGSVLLKLQAVNGAFEISEAWQSQGVRSVMRNEWQTSILLDGHLYGFDNVGSAGQVTHLTCIEASTGKRVWQEARFGKGNMISADGKLFMSTMKGEVVIARASPTGYQELGRKRVIETTRQAPALADGRLYLRDEEEIVCLDVRQK